MTKTELIEKLAEVQRIPKSAAAGMVDSVFSLIQESVAAGQAVEIKNFGKFMPVDRAARIGRNPKTNEEISIPATRHVKFKPGRQFRDSLNPHTVFV